MIQNKNQNIYLGGNNLCGPAMSKLLATGWFKWIGPKDFDLNKYNKNSSKGCALGVDFECPKELQELHNDNPLAPDKTEIKKEMLQY